MTYIKASVMRSRSYGGLPDRYPSTQANPVGNPGRVTRETAPLQPGVSPRVMHPKLNGTPWSTSFRMKRTAIPKRKARKVRKG